MELEPAFDHGNKSTLCKVGSFLSSFCNKSSTQSNDLFIIEEKLSKEQLQLLIWRTGCQHFDKEDTICSDHFNYYIINFEKRQKACSDPFKRHLKPLTNKKDLRKISLQKAIYHKATNNVNLIPGRLLCSTCRKTLNEENEPKQCEENTESDENADNVETNIDIELASRLTEKEKLNESLIGIDVTPLKLQSISSHSKQSYAKRKLKQAESQI